MVEPDEEFFKHNSSAPTEASSSAQGYVARNGNASAVMRGPKPPFGEVQDAALQDAVAVIHLAGARQD
jgi:hypothetical protein